ncbi:MAG: MlaD family protein [Planctomycetota bacterium]
MRGLKTLVAVLAFAAAVGTGLVWTLRQMKTERSMLAKGYTVSFRESVDGLMPGASVTVNGVRKGRVLSFDLDPRDIQCVLVEFELQVDVDAAKVVAVLETKFPSGQKWIDLRFVDKTPPGMALEKNEVRASPAKSYFHIAERLDQTLEEVKSLLQKDVRETIGSMKSTIDEVRTFFQGEDLRKALEELNGATKDFRGVLARIDKAFQENEGGLNRTVKAAADGAESVQKAAVRLDDILKRLDSSLGDVQGASQETRLRLRETFDGVNRSVRLLEETLSEIRDNPSVLLRGRSYEARPIPDR